jgi:RNase P subunit RPR2
MKKTTCAACDCELGPGAISVKLGGKTVEVCCQECAEALKEAETTATAATAASKD